MKLTGIAYTKQKDWIKILLVADKYTASCDILSVTTVVNPNNICMRDMQARNKENFYSDVCDEMDINIQY